MTLYGSFVSRLYLLRTCTQTGTELRAPMETRLFMMYLAQSLPPSGVLRRRPDRPVPGGEGWAAPASS